MYNTWKHDTELLKQEQRVKDRNIFSKSIESKSEKQKELVDRYNNRVRNFVYEVSLI